MESITSIKIVTAIHLTGTVLLMMACNQNKGTDETELNDLFSGLQEIQLTTDPKGHFLHQFQYFSPNDEWLAYDTRNDDTRIGSTCCVEMVNVRTKETVELYRTKNQTEFGPGVGAVTFNPKKDQVLFIHGLTNSDSERPYGFSRRTGVSVTTNAPGVPVYLDARDVTPPFTAGALRGGTHAHSWSRDGEWVSFTYNDDIVAKLAESGENKVKDLRMVGVMAPVKSVEVDEEETGENVSGEMFSVIVSEVSEEPEPGSDQIDRAHGDAFVGSDGYLRPDGSQQKRAAAFLGDTRDIQGNSLTEVFVCDLPEDITKSTESQPIQGTPVLRPMPPRGTRQRRISHTQNRKFPGVQGPRHSIRSLADGSLLLFMMKNDDGVVQIYGLSPNGGTPKQITENQTSVETTFDVSPNGQFLAYGINEKVHITEIRSGKTVVIEPGTMPDTNSLKSISWSNDGKMIAYNRKVMEKDTSYFQVFILR